MANFPNQFHYQYIPSHMLQLAYQQKNSQLPYNPAPRAWMARYLDGVYDNRFRGNVGAQLGMVIPHAANVRHAANVGRQAVNAGQGIPVNSINQQSHPARKRTRYMRVLE